MSRSIRQVLVVSFGLSLSSLALARAPQPLVAQQQASANATRESGGYRDMNARFGDVASRAPMATEASGGYRDMHVRLAATSPSHRAASVPAPTGLR